MRTNLSSNLLSNAEMLDTLREALMLQGIIGDEATLAIMHNLMVGKGNPNTPESQLLHLVLDAMNALQPLHKVEAVMSNMHYKETLHSLTAIITQASALLQRGDVSSSEITNLSNDYANCVRILDYYEVVLKDAYDPAPTATAREERPVTPHEDANITH